MARMQSVPPFVQNSDDDLHCVNAVFRMVAQQFLGKDFSWEEIDALTKAQQGKATWTFIGETAFARMGLQVKNIEPLDYEKLYTQGVAYLKETFGPEVADYYINKSNIASVLEYIPEFLKYVEHETRCASMQEICTYVKAGKLVGTEVNSSILNSEPGFDLHFVLLYDADEEHVLLHDPGLPPLKERRVSFNDFERCFNYDGAGREIVVFSKRAR